MARAAVELVWPGSGSRAGRLEPLRGSNHKPPYLNLRAANVGPGSSELARQKGPDAARMVIRVAGRP